MTLSFLDSYDTRFADLAQSYPARERRHSQQLLKQLLAEGARARADYVIDFLRSSGEVPEAAFTADGLSAIDDWLTTAPIEVEELEPGDWRTLQLRLPWRALTVDLMILLGEYLRETDYPKAEWGLATLPPDDTWRLLPVLQLRVGKQTARYRVSGQFLGSVAGVYGRRYSGLGESKVTDTPMQGLFEDYLWDVRFAKRQERERRADEKRRNYTPPPIPPLPEESRKIYQQAKADNRLGTFGDFWVFAPMSKERARKIIDSGTSTGKDKVNPALATYVTELYKIWPHHTDDDEYPSPWETDLYNGITGQFVELAPSRYAPAGPVYEAMITIARRLKMPVYSTEDGDFHQ